MNAKSRVEMEGELTLYLCKRNDKMKYAINETTPGIWYMSPPPTRYREALIGLVRSCCLATTKIGLIVWLNKIGRELTS